MYIYIYIYIYTYILRNSLPLLWAAWGRAALDKQSNNATKRNENNVARAI